VHCSHELDKAWSEVESQSLVINNLEDSFEWEDINELAVRSFISASVEIGSEIDEGLEVFKYSALITAIGEIFQAAEGYELVALDDARILRIVVFHSYLHHVIPHSKRHQ